MGSILPIILSGALMSQTHNHLAYGKMYEYSKFGVHIGSTFFTPASTTNHYGNIEIKNKTILNYSFGINYYHVLQNEWMIMLGIWSNPEPLFSMKFTIKEYDLPSDFGGDLIFKDTGRGIFTFSFPLLFTKSYYHKKNLLSIIGGYKLMYLPDGYALVSVDTHRSENPLKNRKFTMTLYSSNKHDWYHSLVLGGGISFPMENALIQLNLLYIYNLQPTITGSYIFTNLKTQQDAGGDYTLSGSHIMLECAYRIKKSHKKLRKINRANQKAFEIWKKSK